MSPYSILEEISALQFTLGYDILFTRHRKVDIISFIVRVKLVTVASSLLFFSCAYTYDSLSALYVCRCNGTDGHPCHL